MVKVVRLQQRDTKGSPVFLVTIPKQFVDELGLSKGDLLAVKIVEIDGRKGVFFSKIEI